MIDGLIVLLLLLSPALIVLGWLLSLALSAMQNEPRVAIRSEVVIHLESRNTGRQESTPL